MAGFVGVSGPGASGEEPDRQEGQVERRKCSVRLVYSVAGVHHLFAGKLRFAAGEFKFQLLTVSLPSLCWVVRLFIRWRFAHV